MQGLVPLSWPGRGYSYLTKLVNIYVIGGVYIRTIFMDQEFDKIVENMPDVDINNMAAMEHVGGI